MSVLEKLKELQLEINLDKDRKSKSEYVAKDEWYAPMSELAAADYLIDTLLPSLIAALEMIEEMAKEVTCEDIFDRPHPADAVSSFARELLTKLEGDK